MVQRRAQQPNSLHQLGYKIFLDRYAQKDMTRTSLEVGDTVIVVVDSVTGQREVGTITALDLPQVSVKLLDETEVTRDVEHVDKPLETRPEEMMDRVARGVAEIETTPELQEAWQEKFRWLLDDWKFVPGGRILTAAGTDQELTFYNCMPPEQEVLTVDGYKPIAEVAVGDLVVTHKNRLRPVLHKFERETEEDLFIIKPKKIEFDDLRVTGEHKVYVIRSEWVNKYRSRDGLQLKHQPDWIPAKDLKPGDYVALAHNQEECPPESIFVSDYVSGYELAEGKLFRSIERSDYHGHLRRGGTKVDVTDRLDVDEDLCYLFGRWLGDGCVTHRTKTDIPSGIKIVFSLDEKAEAEHLAEIIERKFSVPAALKLSSTERWYDLWVNSMPVGEFFKALLGHYSYGKRLPLELMRLPDHLTTALLRGLFQADGYTSGKYLGILLPNRTLATQVHELLMRLGYLFSIQENTHRLGRVPAYRVTGTVSECEPLWQAFFDEQAPENATSLRYHIEYDDLRWVRIADIGVETYSGIVMDMEVAEDHSFVSSGVVVSNCYVLPSPNDSREGIIKTLGEMTEIMSRGGGVGINISTLRPRHAYVKGVNGRSSGSVSWGALYSFVTGLIEQGGCFGPDERIATDRGLIPAAEVADLFDAGESLFAQTHKGLRKITARFRNGVKPLFEVTTKRGFKVRITEDHKVAVLMDGQIITMPLKYLQPGDEILLLLGQPVDSLDVTDNLLTTERAYEMGNAPELTSIPEAIFRSHFSVQMAFVTAYLNEGGHNPEVLQGVQEILAANGIISTLHVISKQERVYRLDVELERLGAVQVVNAILPTEAASSNASNTMPDEIVSIEAISEQEVYDFEVEDVHLLSGGGVYTSNSRRGALMLILNDWHPDVFDFINSKREAGKITNANISVGVSDKLMEAVKADADWDLVFPDTSDPDYDEMWDGDLETWVSSGRQVIRYKTVKAREVWHAIIESAWASAEPGVWFRERSNKMANSWYFNPLVCTNPCVTGETRIFTDKGLVRAVDLFNDETQIEATIDGRFGLENPTTPATRVFRTGRKSVYKLQTEEGYSIRATADHRFMTPRGWVELQDLQPGDHVHVLNRKGGFGQEGSLELGRVLGWLVGDGTIKADRAVLSFFGDEKRELAPVFAGYVNDLVAPMTTGARTYTVGVVEVGDRDEARVQSDRLRTLVAEYGLLENKHQVPEIVFRGTEDMQRGYLQALFTADGSVQGTVEKALSVRLAANELDLLRDVQLLLGNFGIASRIYESRRKAQYRPMPDGKGGLKDYWCAAQHELVISRANLMVFAEEVGFVLERKQLDLLARLGEYKRAPRSERFTVRVKSIVESGVEDVYDLTEPRTHSFVGNYFVIHNCGEQPLGSYSVCNLGAINLSRFYDADKHDVAWDDLKQAIHYATRFLDNVIDSTPYFFPENEKVQLGERRVGLGTMGIAELMIRLGIRYGSDASVQFIDKVYRTIAREAYRTSAELAAEKGAFPQFDTEKFLESGYMQQMDLDIRELISKYGSRNVTLLTQAPTGTTGTMVNTSTGIEPFFSWVYYRKSRLGLHEEQVPLVKDYYEQNPNADTLPDHFVTAMDLTPKEHVRVQAAFQRWIDSAISKTSNVPNEYTVEQVAELYEYMYDQGCKGGTIYRDGSRDEQVLMLKPDEADEAAVAEKPIEQVTTPHRVYPRPKKLTGVTVDAPTPFGHAYITMNADENGYPFEVFIVAPGKAGSDLQADAEGLGRMISLSLRTTAPQNRTEMLKLIIDQLRDIGGTRSYGFGPQRVKSLPDAVANAMEEHFFPNEQQQQLALPMNGDMHAETTGPVVDDAAISGADMCPSCGTISLIRAEGCRKCLACGYSEC